MTFTKEKMAELLGAQATLAAWRTDEASDADLCAKLMLILEACAALPHYITALAEAERALEQYEVTLNEAADDYNKIEKVCLNYGLMTAHREAIETAAYIRAMLRGHSKALTTIRQLARGNT